jgi:hypothetical protein
MSSISMEVPAMQINSSDLRNLVKFIYAHEQPLKEFGAIKIQLNSECTLALKKRQISPTCTTSQQITKVGIDEPIYIVQNGEQVNNAKQRLSTMNEHTFWSSLSDSSHKCDQSSVSILPNKTLFYQKWNGKYFTIQSIPRQSLLRLGGTKLTDQYVSCLSRAHGPGAIYPLSFTQQRLCLLVYHHQGGPRHWYVIPNYEREILTKILEQQSPSSCLEHGQLLIDPLLLDKYHIRYHRIIQYPKEFVVLSAGVLTQSFTEGANWSESIPFALPSWIEEGHANHHNLPCQCNINMFSQPKTIDVSLFKYELIQKYKKTHLNADSDNSTLVDKG